MSGRFACQNPVQRPVGLPVRFLWMKLGIKLRTGRAQVVQMSFHLLLMAEGGIKSLTPIDYFFCPRYSQA